jgi:hypothetical protein
MGLDTTEQTEKIEKTHLQKLLSRVNPEDPRYRPFFEIYKGHKGPTETEYIQAIISIAAIDPKPYFKRPEGKKEFYDAKYEAIVKAGLIKEGERLKPKDSKFLKISSNALREHVQATSPSDSGWAGTAAMGKSKAQARRPSRDRV